MKWLGRGKFGFIRGQRGFTLLEVLVAVAILAAIGVVLLNGLSTGYKSLDISRERTFAESLAKSQVEYVKDQAYISVLNYDPGVRDYQVIYIPADLTSAGYTVEISPVEVADNGTAGISGYELQSITIKVKYQGNVKLTITFYRTGLAL